MKIDAFIRIGIVWAVACAALIALVIVEGRARAAGTEVRFAMQAIDPRSLLSGHYVIVDLQRNLPEGAACAEGADVSPTWNGAFTSHAGYGWIALREDPAGAVVAGVSQDRAAALANSPLTVRGLYNCQPPAPAQTTTIDGQQTESPARAGWERLDLGITRFHINQADALAIEERLREQRGDEQAAVFAIVSLGPDGRARLMGLEVNAERLMLSWR